MLLRLLTSLLLVSLLFPAGVFGAVVHRCQRGLKLPVSTSSCCQAAANSRAASGGIVQLEHHCQKEAAPASQLATVNPKLQIDAAHTVESGILSVASLRLAHHSLGFSPFPAMTRPVGGGPPVFLRTCSFLI